MALCQAGMVAKVWGLRETISGGLASYQVQVLSICLHGLLRTAVFGLATRDGRRFPTSLVPALSCMNKEKWGGNDIKQF